MTAQLDAVVGSIVRRISTLWRLFVGKLKIKCMKHIFTLWKNWETKSTARFQQFLGI